MVKPLPCHGEGNGKKKLASVLQLPPPTKRKNTFFFSLMLNIGKKAPSDWEAINLKKKVPNTPVTNLLMEPFKSLVLNLRGEAYGGFKVEFT